MEEQSKIWLLTHDVEGQTEDQLQQKCVFWFNNEYPKFRGCLFHVPNGGMRNAREAKKFKQMGTVRGVADLLLMVGACTYCIELKKKGGRQSKSQEAWEKQIRNNGFDYVIVKSLAEFKAFVAPILDIFKDTY